MNARLCAIILVIAIVVWGRHNRHTPVRVSGKGESIPQLLVKKRGAR